MANLEDEAKDMDKGLSYAQMFKAGFAGNATAQLKQKRRYMEENKEPVQQSESPEAVAIRMRRIQARKDMSR